MGFSASGAQWEMREVRHSAVWAPLLDDDLPITIVIRLMPLVRRRARIRHTRAMEARFVDCRDHRAYLAGHIPGAAHADPERDLTGTDPRRHRS